MDDEAPSPFELAAAELRRLGITLARLPALRIDEADEVKRGAARCRLYLVSNPLIALLSVGRFSNKRRRKSGMLFGICPRLSSAASLR
jgi:hypothetical protein